MEKKKIALFTTVHFFNDSYASFLPPLLPLLIKQLGISITAATFLVSIFTFSSSITQPVFGYLADKVKRRYFLVLGLILSATFMSSIGLASDYRTLGIILLMGGLGIAAFHPQTVGLAGAAAGSRKGLGVSIFISGGTIGYSIGPIWIVYMVMIVGLERSYLAAIPGLVVAALLFRGNTLREKLDTGNGKLSIARSLWPQARAIAVLFVIVVLWTATRMGFVALLPILYAHRGMSLLYGGAIITLFVISGAVGVLLGGHLSDIMGRKIVILVTMLLSVPFLIGFTKTTGPFSVTLLAVGGVFLMGSASVVIAMAQELIPENVGTASSIVMGLAWGIGGALVVLFGMMAERWGILSALLALSFLPLLGAFCALLLPERTSSLIPLTLDGK